VVDDKVSLSSLFSHEELVQRPPRENNSLTLQPLVVGVCVCYSVIRGRSSAAALVLGQAWLFCHILIISLLPQGGCKASDAATYRLREQDASFTYRPL